MSLFELPVTRSARVARVAAVLLLDVVLAGSGIAMGLSWWSSRNAAAAPEPPAEVKPEEPSEPPPPVTPPTIPDVQAEEPRKLDKKPTRAGAKPQPPPTGPIVPPVWPGTPDAAPLVTPPPQPLPVPASPPDAAPTPTTGEPEVDADGEISSEAVRNVVHQHMADVKRCYSRAAKVGTSTQPIEGKVEIQFTIRTTGDAEDVRVVDNTTGSEQLGTCVAALLASWRFPSPEEDVEFVWPFVFKAPK